MSMEKNEIRIGNKSKSTYLNSIFYVFNNNSVDNIHVKGLGSQSSKAIEIAERAEELTPRLRFIRIESIQEDGVGGHDAILKVQGGGEGSR